MFKFERVVAFLIDGILMIVCLFAFTLVSGPLELLVIKMTRGSVAPQLVGAVFLVGAAYNVFWVYHLALGSLLGGSIGKRVFGLQIVNSSGTLEFIDLLKRYSFFILTGIAYAVGAAYISANTGSVHLGGANFLLNTYPLLIVVYLIAGNFGGQDSAYDSLCGLRIVKKKPNRVGGGN